MDNPLLKICESCGVEFPQWEEDESQNVCRWCLKEIADDLEEAVENLKKRSKPNDD